MLSAILSGLSDKSALRPEGHCPSKSCDWEAFSSLAICSLCNDVTGLLQPITKNGSAGYTPQVEELSQYPSALYGNIDDYTVYTLPNGLYIDRSNHTIEISPWNVGMVTYGTNNRSETVTFKNEESMMWSMTMIKMEALANASLTFDSSFVDNRSMTAMECGLYYCINEYRSRITNGTLYETTNLNVSTRVKDSWQPIDQTIPVPPPGILNPNVLFLRTDMQFGTSNETFNLSQTAIGSIGAAISQTFLNTASGSFITDDITNGFYLFAEEESVSVVLCFYLLPQKST